MFLSDSVSSMTGICVESSVSPEPSQNQAVYSVTDVALRTSLPLDRVFPPSVGIGCSPSSRCTSTEEKLLSEAGEAGGSGADVSDGNTFVALHCVSLYTTDHG